jgi:quercetin dioxygenase-like cupin family protein
MLKTIFTILLFAAVGCFAQQQEPVDVSAEPHHKHVLENIFVRAYAVTVDPKQSTLMHRHGHDYLSISLGEAEITNNRQGAQPAVARFKDGDVRFSAAPLVHAVTDNLDTPFRNITIELMQPTTNQKACTESCTVPVPCESADKSSCVTEEKLMTADQWSVTRITLPAGAKYPQHTHLANFLTIPLTDAEIKVRVQDGPETEAHYKTGELRWNNPVVHTITNPGKSAVKVIVLEFRGRPSGEGSESMTGAQKPAEHKPHEHR